MHKVILEHLKPRKLVYRRGKALSQKMIGKMYKKHLPEIENESTKNISIKLTK